MAKSYSNVLHLVDFIIILLAQETSIEDVLKIHKCPEYFVGCCPHRFCHPRAGAEKNGIITNFDWNLWSSDSHQSYNSVCIVTSRLKWFVNIVCTWFLFEVQIIFTTSSLLVFCSKQFVEMFCWYFANKLWKYFEHSVHDLCTAPSAASIVFSFKDRIHI